MKKAILLTFLLIVVQHIYAQNQGTLIGVEWSPVSTRLWGNSLVNSYKSLPGSSPGINLDFLFSKHLSFRTGIALERKGFSNDYSSENAQPLTRYKMYFDYLTLPLALTYSTGGLFKLYAEGGPFLGYLLNEKEITHVAGDERGIVVNNVNQFKKADAGFMAGVGIHVPAGPNLYFNLGVEDYLGLSNISKLQVFEGRTIRTNVLKFRAGVKYRLGKNVSTNLWHREK
jgi:hypothetical protein